MPPALDQSVKDRVRRLWFSGEKRKDIADECQVGAGSVTNIVNEWTKGLDESDLEWIRELAVQLKKEGTTLGEFASTYRRHNYIKKLGANEDQIERLIVNLASLPEPEKLIDVSNQVAQFSKSQSIPFEALADHIKKLEEKQRLEEEIQQAGAKLQSKNVDIETSIYEWPEPVRFAAYDCDR